MDNKQWRSFGGTYCAFKRNYPIIQIWLIPT